MLQDERICLVVDDMFFAAKINAAASHAGRQVERIKSREQLEQTISESPPALIIIDLNADRLDPLETISFLKAQPATHAVPIVAFVSHVETALIRRAQAAGCDMVLPRSAFTQMLADIVAGNLERVSRRDTHVPE
jgi:CheY-like chemotaxis protein